MEDCFPVTRNYHHLPGLLGAQQAHSRYLALLAWTKDTPDEPTGLLESHLVPNSPLSHMKKVCKMKWSPCNPVFLPTGLSRPMSSVSSLLFEPPTSLMVLFLCFGVDLSWGQQ